MIVPSHFTFSTTPDATPPAFVASFPRLGEVTDSSVKLDVQLDEPGEHSLRTHGHGVSCGSLTMS